MLEKLIYKIRSVSEKYQIIFMIALTLFLQIIMLLINSLTASRFGAEMGLDSFNLSKNISNFAFGLIGAAITTVVVPNLSKNNLENKGVNIFITFIYSVLTIVFIIILTLKKYLILIIAGEKTESFIKLTELILNIVMTSYYILSFSNILIAIYQIKNKFNFIKAAQMLSNLIVLFLLYYFKSISIIKYALFIAAGNMLNLLFLLLDYKNLGYKYKFTLDLKNEEFKLMLKNLIPILCATGLYQLSLMIDTMLATRSGEGELSLLSYSVGIVGMINTLFVGNLVMYAYPKLAASIQKKDNSAKKLFYDYSLFMITVTILLVIGFLIVGKEFISILLERGKFTSKETNVVYIATVLYIISLPFSAIRDLSYRYFYSNHDTKTPFSNSLKSTILNIIFSIVLAKKFGLNGIILGTTLSTICSTTLIKFKLIKNFNLNLLGDLSLPIIKVLGSGSVSYLIGKFLFNYLHNLSILLKMGITSVLISIVYFILLIILRFEPLINLKKRKIYDEKHFR